MARRGQQFEFTDQRFQRPKDWFGGSYLKNSNAKCKRPLDSRFAIHMVLRSITSEMRKPKIFPRVDRIVSRTCKRHGVRLYEFANLGNHLHLLIRIPHVRAWAAFIRELTGRLAHQVQGLGGRAKGRKFWAQRPFTRIVRGWKRAYRIAKDYVILNKLEAEGFISRAETRNLRELRAIWSDG